MRTEGFHAHEPVTIAMCTFRRPSAFAALESFRALRAIEADRVAVLVIDNDESDVLRASFEAFAQTYPFSLQYVHAPARNISLARNAALDQAKTRWLAFIDDDEAADPDWLAHLLSCRETAQAVIGRCEAVYGPELPRWVQRCDFHSNRITGSVTNAYTSNALLDLEFVRRHGLRFRPDLGRTGGEDTLFFRELVIAGGNIAYCPQALVLEEVPATRANMRWVQKRMYRAGQTHGLVCREFDRSAYATLLITAGAKAAFSALMALATVPGSDRSRRWFARAHLHLGAAHYRIRPSILEEYA